MTNAPAPDSLNKWCESAPYWAKHSDTIRQMFAPVTRALIEDARIVPGDFVLDVAGGAGEPSLTIAETVGTSGQVVCTDPVAMMVAAAKNEAGRRGIKHIEFSQCTAETLPFRPVLFDAIVCRLGAMFFVDPVEAVREMLRVAKTGGRLGFVVWHKSELNPFCHLVSEIMSEYVEAPAADENAPGAFRFAEPGTLPAIVREAGAVDVRERVIEFQIEAPLSPEQFWELRSQISETLRDKLKALSAEQRSEIGAKVIETVSDYFPAGQMSFPAQMILVTGRKPASRVESPSAE